MLNLLPLTATLPPRRGRRPVAADPAERAKHLLVGLARCRPHRVPTKQLAARLGCSERSIRRWSNAALSYNDPLAVALRQMAGSN